MRWSYKTIHFELKKEGLLGSAFIDESEIEETLNNYGRSGWELVSMLETRDGVIAVFKQAVGGTRLPTEDAQQQASSEALVVSAVTAAEAMEKAAADTALEPSAEPSSATRLSRQSPQEREAGAEQDAAVEQEAGSEREVDQWSEEEADTDGGIGSIRIE